MSRDILEDLETLDASASERLDALFASLPPTDHASRIVKLADSQVISDIELVD